MLELINENFEVLNTKERITIDLIKDGIEFLEKFDINHDMLMDTVSIIYQYLRNTGKIPHNLYKFFIAAYYIVSRHPRAFPVHEPKSLFCNQFGIQQNSLEYSVEKIVKTLGFIKILDDTNYPYFLWPKNDLGFKVAKRIIKDEVEKSMMNFLLYNQVINSQILCEELVTKFVFEMDIFPEELFRQFFEVLFDLIEKELHDYNEYVHLQQKIFI
jgi:hypothetical protein